MSVSPLGCTFEIYTMYTQLHYQNPEWTQHLTKSLNLSLSKVLRLWPAVRTARSLPFDLVGHFVVHEINVFLESSDRLPSDVLDVLHDRLDDPAAVR